MQPTPEQLDEQRARIEAQAKIVVADCHRVFRTVEGARFLNHLNAHFGMGSTPGGQGMSDGDLRLRVGSQIPLFYIQKLLNTPDPSQAPAAPVEPKTNARKKRGAA